MSKVSGEASGRVRPGESVLVVGRGGDGMNVVQGAALSGATTIIAADIVQAKIGSCLRLHQSAGGFAARVPCDSDAVAELQNRTGEMVTLSNKAVRGAEFPRPIGLRRQVTS
jgi:Zn-dependent alcohol dehydrogenase